MKNTKPPKNELCNWQGKYCSQKSPINTIEVCDQATLICSICLGEFERKLKDSGLKQVNKMNK